MTKREFAIDVAVRMNTVDWSPYQRRLIAENFDNREPRPDTLMGYWLRKVRADFKDIIGGMGHAV